MVEKIFQCLVRSAWRDEVDTVKKEGNCRGKTIVIYMSIDLLEMFELVYHEGYFLK